MTDSIPDNIEIRRSHRRRKTISGRIENDRVVVMVPAGLSQAAEDKAVADILTKLRKQQRRKNARAYMSDEELATYVRNIDQKYCGGRAQPLHTEWSRDVRTRWGSCTTTTRTIRLHPLLATMPKYVMDYVIVHELCHLTTPGGHTAEFWAAVDAYPKVERARGYLEAAAKYDLDG